MLKIKHRLKKMLVRLLGNEKYQGITIPMSAIFLSLLAGAVIILSLGKNPLSAYGIVRPKNQDIFFYSRKSAESRKTSFSSKMPA